MSAIEPTLNLRVNAIAYQGEGINAYELVDVHGSELPVFTAGAHVDIHLPQQLIRQYSLCNDPAQRHCYVLCIQREDNGQGGSKAAHDSIRVGQIVKISHPRNNFPLASDAARHVFLAGGIGITPIMAMLRTVRLAGTPWQLTYCTRSSDSTAFLEELARDFEGDQVTLHHDEGQTEKSLNLQALLSEHQPGSHLYYCGPPGFMAAVADATSHWPRDAVHFEHFSVPDTSVQAANSGDAATGVANDSFQIKINSTGVVYDVPQGKSIVQVLAENGIDVATSCEAGLCGTCQTNYLEGKPDHRDHILSEEDKTQSVLICCARSLSSMLVLDL